MVLFDVFGHVDPKDLLWYFSESVLVPGALGHSAELIILTERAVEK
jgi:hypothetical protein